MSTKKSCLEHLFNGHVDLSFFNNYPFLSKAEGHEDFRMMVESVLGWLKAEVNADEIDKQGKLPLEVIQSMKDLGLFGLIIPTEFGGLGLSQTQYARLLDLMNGLDSSVTITAGAHSSIGLKGLVLFGTEEQKKRYYPKLASGEMIASFALTEPTAGSDAAGIASRIVRDGDYYILNGTKQWITNGAYADFFTVFAKEEIEGKDRMTALIVTRDMGGVTHGEEEHKLGIKGSSTVEINFKNTRVPIDHVLGKPGEGFKVAMHILNQGRTGLAAGSLGPVRRAIELVTEFAKERKTFGRPIIEYDVIGKLLNETHEELYAAESITYFTTFLIDQKDVNYHLEAAAAKVYATEMCWQSLNRCLQILGGNGYMRDYILERMMRDSRIGLIFEGTNEILKQFIGLNGIKMNADFVKGLTSQFKKSMRDWWSDRSKWGEFKKDLAELGTFTGEILKGYLWSPTLSVRDELVEESRTLSEAAHLLQTWSLKLIKRHGKKVIEKQLEVEKLGELAIESYKIYCVLSRLQTRLTQKNQTPGDWEKELKIGKKVLAKSRRQIRIIDQFLKYPKIMKNTLNPSELLEGYTAKID